MLSRYYLAFRRCALLAILAGLPVIQGCKDPGDRPEFDNSFLVINNKDPRVQNLATPATRPVKHTTEPRIIEQGDRSTLIYTCRDSRAETLADAVDGLISPEGSVSPSPSLNVLVIHDRKENVQALLDVLQELDRPTNQLLVEARVLEVTVDRDLETDLKAQLRGLGADSVIQNSDLLNLLTPGATPLTGQGANVTARILGPGDSTLDIMLRFLLSRGRARILSSPNLLVSPGTEASIITGQEVPIQSVTNIGNNPQTSTQFKRVGIKLRVNLLQLTNDTARLELNPEVSTVTRYITTANNNGQEVQNPVVAIRNVSSTLSLKDGELLAVGGLLSTEDRNNVRGVPGLMDVPVAGEAFKSRREQAVRTQVIFFLKVRVVPAGEIDGTRVYEPDSNFKLIDEVLAPAKIDTVGPATKPTTQPEGEGR
jgi:general secretion pathway protein D